MNKATPDNVANALRLALDLSISIGNMEMLKMALDKGADAQRALDLGHKTSNWAVIDLALAAGADINACVADQAAMVGGDTYLISSMRRKEYTAAENYLDRGADPNLTLGDKMALEILLENMQALYSQGYRPADMSLRLYKRLIAVLPQGNQGDMGLKKEVVLRAPQAVFKEVGGKPQP